MQTTHAEPGLPSSSALDRALAPFEAEHARWFYWAPVMLALGIGIYFHLPAEPGMVLGLAPLAAAIVLRRVWRGGLAAQLLTAILLLATLGLALAKLRTEWVRAPVLERSTGLVVVRGYVELVEPRYPRGQRVTLRLLALGELPREAVPYRVRLRLPGEPGELQPGDAVQVRARLSPPAGPALPGAFDFARQAWYQRLGGVGYGFAKAARDPTAPEPPLSLRIASRIEALRQAIGRRVQASLPGETGAIATALVTGERGGISERTNDAFRDSGLLHILSISGLHMVIMAGAVFWSVRLLLAAVPRIALRYPIKKWAAAAAALGALAYLMISGAAFATVRSYIMISIMFLAVLVDRPAIAFRNVALAALAILVLYPESLLDVGFQMSFAAVVALVAVYEQIRERAHERPGGFGPLMQLLLFFGGIVLSTLIASLSVAPFAAYHFHKSQQYAILANLIAIPVCNVLVMPAALATLLAMPFGLEAAPLWAMGQGIEAMVWCARAVAALPGAVGRIPAFSAAAFALMVAGGLWMALWRTRWRLAGALAILAGIVLATQSRRPDVLIGRDGTLVALRAEGARLAAVAGRGATYDLARWLEHDGDDRSPAEATRSAGMKCDAIGCSGAVGAKVVALAASPAALADDCERADIVVTTTLRPPGCTRPRLVIDRPALRRHGAHALYLAPDGTIRTLTVAEMRGDRPWAPSSHKRGDAERRAGSDTSPLVPAGLHAEPDGAEDMPAD